MKNKFEIGDRVIGNSKANKYYETVEGYIAVVIETDDDYKDEITIKKLGGLDRETYAVDSDAFDLYRELSISEDFAKRLHNECNAKCKKMLEQAYPEIFADPIQQAVNKIGQSLSYPTTDQGTIAIFNNSVLVPIPNANSLWTITAFDYVKKFVAEFPNSFPIHGASAREICEEYTKTTSDDRQCGDYLVIRFYN